MNEALRLADALDECKYVDVYRCKQAGTRLTAQRDALLAALKRAEPLLIGPILLQARAAIKAVEGEKS